jgi:hypothetical protein
LGKASDDGGDGIEKGGDARGRGKGGKKKASKMRSQNYSFGAIREEISLKYAFRQGISAFLCIFNQFYAVRIIS